MRIRVYGILLVVIISFSSCSNIGDKIYVEEPSNVEIQEITGNKVRILTVLPITNNNGFKIKLKDLELDARVNGTYLGPVTSSDAVIIPGNSKGEYPILLELEVKNIVLGLTTIYKLAQGKSNTKLSLEGNLKASSFLINKKIPIKEDNLMQYMN